MRGFIKQSTPQQKIIFLLPKLCFLVLGPQAKEVLQSFLQSQAIMEESILQSDKALTDTERAIAGRVEGSTVRGVGTSCKAL